MSDRQVVAKSFILDEASGLVRSNKKLTDLALDCRRANQSLLFHRTQPNLTFRQIDPILTFKRMQLTQALPEIDLTLSFHRPHLIPTSQHLLLHLSLAQILRFQFVFVGRNFVIFQDRRANSPNTRSVAKLEASSGRTMSTFAVAKILNKKVQSAPVDRTLLELCLRGEEHGEPPMIAV